MKNEIAVSSQYVYGEPNSPDIIIDKLNNIAKEKLQNISLNQTFKTGIKALLPQTPNLTSNITNVSSNFYRVTFSSETMKGLQNGSHSLMNAIGGGQRATVISREGKKIMDQGKIISNPGLNPVSISLIIWQGLTIITAQKYLSEINVKLKNIEDSVSRITDFLENERQGKIIGKVKYLSEIAKFIVNHELTENDVSSFNNKIEDIECECEELMSHLEFELQNHRNSFENIEFQGTGVEDHFNEALMCIKDYHYTNIYYLMILYLRSEATRVKASLPVNKSITTPRMSKLAKLIEENILFQKIFKSEIKEKIPTLEGTYLFSRRDAELEKQGILKKSIKSVSKDLKEKSLEIKSNIWEVQNFLKEDIANNSLSLIVETNNKGNIENIKKSL